jgi:hypothetical protein
MTNDTKGRSIPRGLASLVELMELERPNLITLEQMQEMIVRAGIAGTPNKVVYRLTQHGWLLRTGIAGVYEFAPADRAGAFSQADALFELRAVIAKRPNLQIAAALNTALFYLNIADRAPDVPEVAVSKNAGRHEIPLGLQHTHRVLRFNSILPPRLIQGIPVHQPATILIHAAERPGQVRSWGALLELLPIINDEATVEEVSAELTGRTHATKVRLAYLLQSVNPDLARKLDIQPAGKVWFGPRASLKRHDARWNVADTVLPFSPRGLARHTKQARLLAS